MPLPFYIKSPTSWTIHEPYYKTNFVYNKRMFLLYFLGIPVPEPYFFIFSNMSKIFEYSRKAGIIDLENCNNTCYLDASNKIIFCVRDMVMDEKDIVLNKKLYGTINNIMKEHSNIKVYDLLDMLKMFLTRKGINLDGLLRNPTVCDQHENKERLKYLEPKIANIVKILKW